MAIFRREHPVTEASNAIQSLYVASQRAANAATGQVLITEDDEYMFMTRSLNVTAKTTEQCI